MSVKNVIRLGKLIGLLFLFCLPLLSILFLKTKRNDLARPVIGTIFLVILKIRSVIFLLSLGSIFVLKIWNRSQSPFRRYLKLLNFRGHAHNFMLTQN